MSDLLAIFLDKICDIWRAGKDARIDMECPAGQAWMSLHHRLPFPPPFFHQTPHGRPTPSRVRRWAQRALAWAAAAQADPSPVLIDDNVSAGSCADRQSCTD